MNWLVDNWYILVGLLAVLSMVIMFIVWFLKLPTDKQIENVKEWLKLAVSEAEKELGGGTGQLKLRMVYDMAVHAFPWIVKVVSFSTFEKWVDEALAWMNVQLENNKAIRLSISGKN